MTVRGDKFPAAKAQWLARVKRWVPALADCANLEVANLPTVVTYHARGRRAPGL